MNIKAPTVMPKWEYALTDKDKTLIRQMEDYIMEDAMAHARKVGGWVTIYWDGKDVNYRGGEVIGQASATHANLDGMDEYYAMKYL